MGNRSRYHRPNRDRDYQRGFHDGQHEGSDYTVHLLLADLPGSGVTVDADGGLVCHGGVCHGCQLKRHGFTRLAETWSNDAGCEEHPSA